MNERDTITLIAFWPRDIRRLIEQESYERLLWITLLGCKWELVFERKATQKKAA